MTTTTTRRTWDVEAAWAKYNELDQDTGTRLHSVRSLAAELGVSHNAVATAFKPLREGKPEPDRARLLPYEIPNHLHRTTTGLRLRQLVHRSRCEHLAEKDDRALDAWLSKIPAGMVVVYDKTDDDWVFRRRLPSDKIVYQVMTRQPDE